MGKRLPQQYYIKIKITYDLMPLRSYLSLCFTVPEIFLRNRVREYVPTIIASITVQAMGIPALTRA